MSALPEGVRRARAGDVELAYETFGDPHDPPVLLVMGLATQMLGWPDDLCRMLAGAGHFVIRFDNRDVGLSTRLDDAPRVSLEEAFAGRAAYTLADMAADAAGLLDALGLRDAHVVGASMGGMIAQTMAIEHPERVRSLISIMSTTGDQAVGAPSEAALGALLAPPPRTRQEAQDRAVAIDGAIGGPAHRGDAALLRERAGMAWDRGADPAGVIRQFAAIVASPDRTPRLRELDVPALVVHGTDDPLVTPSGGQATADAIPGAEHVEIPGWGHTFPPSVLGELCDRLVGFMARVEQSRG